VLLAGQGDADGAKAAYQQAIDSGHADQARMAAFNLRVRYLVGCAALPPDVGRRFAIGGQDVLTYAEMMRRYSGVAGLRPRVLLPVPLLTPRLSSLGVGLVTPVPAGPGQAAG
jgi:uncharacterized protein YbjT (DUF2867 family)